MFRGITFDQEMRRLGKRITYLDWNEVNKIRDLEVIESYERSAVTVSEGVGGFKFLFLLA